MRLDHEHRVINGVLKAGLGIDSAESAGALLAKDIEIVSDPHRTHAGDLWPSVWALAAALGRQFQGTVTVNCGLSAPLPAPAMLPSRCRFGANDSSRAFRIGLGSVFKPCDIAGDARGDEITVSGQIDSSVPANPAAGFALAGYLGFAALADVLGIPGFRHEFVVNRLTIPFAISNFRKSTAQGLSMIGIGHIGQAYLSLLWFVHDRRVPLYLLDKDEFCAENEATQILYDGTGLGKPKAVFLADRLSQAGFEVHGEKGEVDWDWKRPEGRPLIVLVGVDNFDVRRMIICAGFDWVFESGVGSDFSKPRVTWHVLRGDRESSRVFSIPTQPSKEVVVPSALKESLSASPGGCGWLTFESTTAAAPSMGLVAAARVLSELSSFADGRQSVSGAGYLWSQLLPILREVRDQPLA